MSAGPAAPCGPGNVATRVQWSSPCIGPVGVSWPLGTLPVVAWKLLGDRLQVRHFPLSFLVCTGTKGGDMAKASRMFNVQMP